MRRTPRPKVRSEFSTDLQALAHLGLEAGTLIRTMSTMVCDRVSLSMVTGVYGTGTQDSFLLPDLTACP